MSWGFAMSELRGKVKFFDEKKGFGFISSGGNDYFVHFRQIKSGIKFKTLASEQQVAFEPVKSEKGWLANNVRIVDGNEL